MFKNKQIKLFPLGIGGRKWEFLWPDALYTAERTQKGKRKCSEIRDWDVN